MKIKLLIWDKILGCEVNREWEERIGYFLIDRYGNFAIQLNNGETEVDKHPMAGIEDFGGINSHFEIRKIITAHGYV